MYGYVVLLQYWKIIIIIIIIFDGEQCFCAYVFLTSTDNSINWSSFTIAHAYDNCQTSLTRVGHFLK